MEIGAAEVTGSPDRDAVSVWSELEAADVALEGADLHGRADGRLPEELGLPVRLHQEPDGAVRPEHRVMPFLGALDRLRRSARAGEVEQVERVVALVLLLLVVWLSHDYCCHCS